MTTDTERAAWIDEARKLGEEHARNAASWIVDGNSDREGAARLLAMLREGDPEGYDIIGPGPNLSGEWADDPTPQSLARDIMGEWDYLSLQSENEWEDSPGELEGALADAYEDGVSETFSLACEAELIRFCEE